MADREFYESLPSTQARAIDLARAGAPAGTRVVARTQSAGRGRSAHRWLSPPGGLYLSVVADVASVHPELHGLALGAVLAEAIDARWSTRIALKWPNDLYAVAPGEPARKLGGILADRVAGPKGVERVVLGVGLNVRTPAAGWPDDLGVPPIGLDALGTGAISLDELESLVVTACTSAGSLLVDGRGAAEVLARCRRRLFGVGRPALVDGRPAGRIAGLADDGAVWIDGPSGRTSVRAGDLAVVEEA
jgi:BirA family biotin operon repressor/biotin-[acetyl-CoA-carboxylase] ligase